MTDTDSNVQERPRTRKVIEDMLTERQAMLVQLWNLAKLDPFEEDERISGALEEFLEILVDYIAAGHFGLYERIATGKERRQRVVAEAEQLYPRIAMTTERAVNFSEKYEDANSDSLLKGFTEDLSRLGEEITTRIELEDQLIGAMLGEEYTIPPAPAG
ncbi:MAG: Rsd/AlgQ family anti-sigma factor [Gammaproteobacteria bacterium]|nr:sigma D regulator [Gammaproteobacteria bacterium]NNM00310.1 Rsd/AlgQ family anti-sigma factor [Gammaproteobacteria bacterium]